MRLEREELLDLEAQLRRTWIVTDGGGAYAAGTPLGCPAARSHGLLVAPVPGQAALHVLLSRLEEWLHLPGRALPLATARYPGAFHPGGHTYLASFELVPWPVWTWQAGDVEVTRELRLAPPAGRPGRGHTLLVRYALRAPPAAGRRLSVRPLLACRAVSELTHENPHAQRRVEAFERGFEARPYPALPALAVTVGGAPARFTATGDWYRRIEYAEDLRAGAAAHEDHLSPGAFEVEAPGRVTELVLAATTGPAVEDPLGAWRALGADGQRPGPGPRGARGAALALHRAADDHLRADGDVVDVVDRLPGGTVSALARFEALPGLLLARGRLVQAGATLRAHAAGVLAPVGQGDGLASDELGLRRAEALAWAGAVERFCLAPGAPEGLRGELLAALATLGARLREAASGDAEAGGSGLLSGASAPGPRRLDVALNARWAGLAAFLARRAGRRGGPQARGWGATARAAAAAFRARFVDTIAGGPVTGARVAGDPVEGGVPASAWHDGAPVASFGPALVEAAAEPLGPLGVPERRAVLARARAELLTPRGLRTLSPRDPAYTPAPPPCGAPAGPSPRGAVQVRGLAPYVEAQLGLPGGAGPGSRARLVGLVDPARHLDGGHGLLHVAEAFDGDPPHAPGGAASDARAVAALLLARARLDPEAACAS